MSATASPLTSPPVDLAGVCTGPGPCDTTPFGAGNNWVNKVGGLPLYIRAIAKALQRSGHGESQAIQLAVGTVQRWARGEGNVSPETRARASAALAEWERKKAQAHSLTAEPAATLDLAWSEQLHPRGGKGTAAGGKFVAKNSTPATPAGMTGNVRDFQKRMGLPVTGIIDAATAAAIRRTAAAKAGSGKGKHVAKHKAKKRAVKKTASKAAKTAAAAHARATQRQVLAQHVATVNSMSVAQRAALRRQTPVPPTGYVWTATNQLRRVKLTRAQQAAPPTGI